MEKWKYEDFQIKGLLVLVIGILAAVLLPLFVIGHYNFQSVDDFWFGRVPAQVWEETGSVLKVLAAQIAYTRDFYYEWQGTYFDVWLTTSLTGILGKNAYFAGTYLSLGGMVAAELAALMVILVKGLGADKVRAAIVAISYICIQVLLTPVPVEAYFWFCGAMRYTFIHGVAWILVMLLLLLCLNDRASKAKTVSLEIGILLLTFAVGGSNYVTGITILLFYFFYVLWMFYKKHFAKVLALINSLVFIVAFLINALAPGNQVRQEESSVASLSVIETIYRSLKEAAKYILVNATLPCVILAVLLIPLLLHIVKKRNYKYPLPLLVSIISCGVFGAQFAPTLYAQQITGPGRVLNLYRFNYYLLLLGNELYWIGWLWRRFREKYGEESSLIKEKAASWLLPGWCLGILMMGLSLNLWGGSTVTTVSAVEALKSGDAKQYYLENQERLMLLEDDSLEEVYLEPFSVEPYLLHFGDIVENTEDWVNIKVSEYFGKKKVGLKQMEEPDQ